MFAVGGGGNPVLLTEGCGFFVGVACCRFDFCCGDFVGVPPYLSSNC
jgi:hypothetical protein